MRVFSRLYQFILQLARGQYAPWYLGLVSFAESSVFIVPPDTMLAPMSMAQPHRARTFAFITTLCSVAGGLLGYCLGHFAFDLLHPYIVQFGYEASYLKVLGWFNYWGYWAVFIAGFAPMPYKVFTITAGAFGLPIIPFVCVSLMSRGLRFFLVAELMRRGGKKMEEKLHHYADMLGWVVLSALLVIIGFFCLTSVTSCSSQHSASGHFAPVTEGWRQSSHVQGAHQVVRGETLYSIAFRYGYDYRQLAARNHIAPPYGVEVGQLIYLSPQLHRAAERDNRSPINNMQRTVRSTTITSPTRANRASTFRPRRLAMREHPMARISMWAWPVRGRLVGRFGHHNSGLDIAGRVGSAVRASAPGEVVYAGNGILGYGNLVIIKHNDEYLSAYAYNKALLVREKDWVKGQQIIAQMGIPPSARQGARLHFEIRRAGKPVNPLRYLRGRGRASKK